MKPVQQHQNPSCRTADPDRLRATVAEQQKVIEELRVACTEALNAIAYGWPYVDFQEGLRQTALEIEGAVAAADHIYPRPEQRAA